MDYPELMPPDADIAKDFLRSDHWAEIRANGRYKMKRGIQNAVRAYMKATYPWIKAPDEATELEKFVGRVEFTLRSGWGKKGAAARQKNRERRHRKKERLAEKAHRKYIADKKAAEELRHVQRSPLLFGEGLPVQRKKKPQGHVT